MQSTFLFTQDSQSGLSWRWVGAVYKRVLLWDFDSAGFISTSTHSENCILRFTSKKNCSGLYHLCLFHLSMTLCLKHLSLPERTTKLFHVSLPSMPLSLMATSITWLFICNKPGYLLPVFSHEGVAWGSILFHSLFSPWYCSTAQLIPFWVCDKNPSQNFLSNVKATFLTQYQWVQQNWKRNRCKEKKSFHLHSPWTWFQQNFPQKQNKTKHLDE